MNPPDPPKAHGHLTTEDVELVEKRRMEVIDARLFRGSGLSVDLVTKEYVDKLREKVRGLKFR